MVTRQLLIVHPDHEYRKKMIKGLLSYPCEVVPARSTRQALGYIRVSKPHLVLTHEHLPDGDAENFITSIRSNAEFREIPIIVSPSGKDQERAQTMRQIGADDVLLVDQDAKAFWKMCDKIVTNRIEEKEKHALGISGQLARFGIIDLIKEMAKEHGSGIISIDGPIPMQIYLKEGALVHAVHGITIGVKALYRCLRIADAAYHFKGMPVKIDATIRGELEDLISDARESNQKLMASFHQLPQLQHRIKIKNWEQIQKINFTAEARAALEIIKRFSLVRDYLDRLNLPDSICYEYLMTFQERDLIEIITQTRPTLVTTDSSVDMKKEAIEEVGLQTVPLFLTGENMELADEPPYLTRLKDMEKTKKPIQILPREHQGFLEKNASFLPTHDCLNIIPSAHLLAFSNRAKKDLNKLIKLGYEGQPLMANECIILETQQFSTGQSLIAQRAAELAKENWSIERIRDKMLQIRDKLHHLVAFPGTKSFIGTRATGYQVQSWTGTEFRSLQKVTKGEDLAECFLQIIKGRTEENAPTRAAVGHIDDPDLAKAIQKDLAKGLPQCKLQILNLGPVSAHLLGFGSVGVAFYQEEKEG